MATRKQLVKQIAAISATDLKWNKKTRDFDPVPVSPTIIERDSLIIVSAEDGGFFADYYGEFRGGVMWIRPDLEYIADAHGLVWEWENPGCISLYLEGV